LSLSRWQNSAVKQCGILRDNMVEKSYFSWIPTVSGRLSYTFFGHTSFPRKCIYYADLTNVDFGKGIFFQERFIDDFNVPFLAALDRARNLIVGKIYAFFTGKVISGRHFFIASVDRRCDSDHEIDRLEGRVFPILASSIGLKVKGVVLDRIMSLESSEGNSNNDLEKLQEDLEKLIAGVCPVVVEFAILRNGITALGVKCRNNAPGFGRVNDAQARDYVEQSYFFLRDLLHNHQHHDPKTDTIVRIHEEDEFRKKIYFDLFRYIIKYKRVRSPENVTNASGILAYAKSFHEIANQGGAQHVPNDYQVENLKMSLDTAQFEVDQAEQRRSNFIALIIALAFSFFGTILSVTTLANFAKEEARELIEVSPHILFLANFTASRPVPVLLGALMMAYVFSSMLGLANPTRRRWYEDLQRLLQWLPKWINLTLLFSVGVVVLWTGLRFV
jgi:hypothetical protein